jgi:hypothetical protein
MVPAPKKSPPPSGVRDGFAKYARRDMISGDPNNSFFPKEERRALWDYLQQHKERRFTKTKQFL